MIEQYKKLCKDKSVLLVGNSVELMDYRLADKIDSYDIVVRFGKAISANEQEQLSIGKKLDIWVTGDFRSKMILKEPYTSMLKDIPILFVRSRIRFDKPYKKIPEINHSYDMFTDKEINKIYQEYNIIPGDINAHRFSAGLWTIKFFCDKVCTYKSLDIIGFDFFAKYTTSKRGGISNPYSWHRPIGTTLLETHSHDQEVSIVNNYIEQNKLNWIILSDLSNKEIKDTKYGQY